MPATDGVKLRILVIEGNETARQRWMDLISPRYPEVGWGITADLTQAIQAVRGEPWNLALMGIQMPDREGLIVLKYLRIDFPDLPVIVLSPQSEKFVALRVLRLGAASCLRRECPGPELLQAVGAALDGKRYFTAPVAEILLENIKWDEGDTAPIPHVAGP